MYTSGSTGRPKGVCVLQRGVVRLVCNTNYLPPPRQQRFTHLSPTTFDASTLEIWGSLLNGATMVLVEGRQPSLDTLAEAIEKGGFSPRPLTAVPIHADQLDQCGLFPIAKSPAAAFDPHRHPCVICDAANAPFGFGYPRAARFYCRAHLPAN